MHVTERRRWHGRHLTCPTARRSRVRFEGVQVERAPATRVGGTQFCGRVRSRRDDFWCDRVALDACALVAWRPTYVVCGRTRTTHDLPVVLSHGGGRTSPRGGLWWGKYRVRTARMLDPCSIHRAGYWPIVTDRASCPAWPGTGGTGKTALAGGWRIRALGVEGAHAEPWREGDFVGTRVDRLYTSRIDTGYIYIHIYMFWYRYFGTYCEGMNLSSRWQDPCWD